MLETFQKHFRFCLGVLALAAWMPVWLHANSLEVERCRGHYARLQPIESFTDIHPDDVPEDYGRIPQVPVTRTPSDVELFFFQTNRFNADVLEGGLEGAADAAKFDFIASNMGDEKEEVMNGNTKTVFLKAQRVGENAHGISLTSRPLDSKLTGVFLQIPAGTDLPFPFALVQDGKPNSFNQDAPEPRGHYTVYPYERVAQPDARRAWNTFMETLKSNSEWGVLTSEGAP